MFKLGSFADGEWRAHSHPPVFSVVQTAGGRPKVLATAPGSDPLVLEALSRLLTPPLFLLYILHTSRGEAEPGRYQSGEMSGGEVRDFIRDHARLLSLDARFDLWVSSPSDEATIVWDRHDLIHGYGPIEHIVACLRGMGFHPGEPVIPAPHEHHYHPELDGLARSLLADRGWTHTPLREEDYQ